MRKVPLIITDEGVVDTQQFLGPRPRQQHLVYYIRRRGVIKIGYTSNLRARMKALHPDELMAIERGTRQLETHRHRQFVAFRAAGRTREWFEPDTHLLEHINERRSALPPPDLALLMRPHSLDVLVDRYGHELRPPNVGGVRGGGVNCKACFSTAIASANHRWSKRPRRQFNREEYRARKYAEIMSDLQESA
jgi:hypothetical protein